MNWIGALPAGWSIVPVKRVAKILNGATPKSGVEQFWDGDINWFTPADLDNSIVTELDTSSRKITRAGLESCATQLAPANSVVISSRAPVGSVGISMVPTATNQGCRTLVPFDGVPAKLLASILMVAREQLQLVSNGTTFLELSTRALSDFKIPLPPLHQRLRIVESIDRTTARIDALINKKVRLIDLLREKRNALVTHIVTKGLDANIALKDSGSSWLGQVPLTWDIAPLRVFLQFRRDIVGVESQSTKLLSLTLQGVIERDLDNPSGKMPASFDSYQRISKGDMVFCLFDMDETPRTVGIAVDDGMLTGAYTVFRPQSELWARYLYYFFLHVDEYKRLRPFYKGLRKTIRPSPFLSIQVPKPPESVARDIVDHLDRATSRIDALVAKTNRSIELLREHRTALITAAVTGKIDLRAA